jgi:outer membrane protein
MYIKDLSFTIAVPNTEALISQVPDTNVDNVYEKALSNMPEVKAAQQNIRTSLLAERVARGGYLPTVTLNAALTTGYSSARTRIVSTQQGGGTVENVYIKDTSGNVLRIPVSLFQNSRSSTRSEKYPFGAQFKDNLNRSINLQATIPILNRLTTKNNVDVAKVNYQKTNNELARVRQTIYNNLALAITEYKNSRKNYQAYKKQVASLEASLKNAETKKTLGVGSSYEVMTSSMLLSSSTASKIQQEYDVIYRKLIIDFYAGIPLSLK